ncbi:uncharacterized protein LOC135333921 isoform X2 [Halichondria panicea]|uniref:uncharacterized protein LOC135333921 isoform X2 n=1 Tax=Halichondria panicea TaxID=6063 RepID=UPI00312BC04A
MHLDTGACSCEPRGRHGFSKWTHRLRQWSSISFYEDTFTGPNGPCLLHMEKKKSSSQPCMSSPDDFYEVGAVSVSRESPALMARHLQRRHQLMVAETPSQSSTPAEPQLADQEVSKLSNQHIVPSPDPPSPLPELSDLPSRLEDLYKRTTETVRDSGADYSDWRSMRVSCETLKRTMKRCSMTHRTFSTLQSFFMQIL